jgi:hypothetical protein
MCGMALAASLALADLYGAGGVATAAIKAPSPLASEPLYADIVSRARDLKQTVLTLKAAPGLKDSAAAMPLPTFALVKSQAAALSELDMKGHVDLAARGTDGDLKCILKGISQDLPKKVHEVEMASTGAKEEQALDDLAYLLNDNVEVITAPAKPPV